MPTKTFHLRLVDGHALIQENEDVILIDTGSPLSIHSRETLTFMNYDLSIKKSSQNVSIDQLCQFLGIRITTLLGMDKMVYYKIIFDYKNERITFSNKTDFEFPGETIPLRIKKKINPDLLNFLTSQGKKKN